MKYKTLTYETPTGLDQMVNDYIDQGWKPYGNPSSIVMGNMLLYSQTMVDLPVGDATNMGMSMEERRPWCR